MKQSLLDKRRERLKNLANQHRRWYDISNKDSDVAEIRIYDEISWWGMTAEDFAQELDEVTADEILVMINSPGGDVFDGIAIYNALRAHKAKVTTRVDGLAASIASVIAQAGDQRVMLSGSQMMIHDAWGLCIGNAQDMTEMAEVLDKLTGNIAGIYATRGNHDREHYRELMRGDTWFDDEEAVEQGLADEVVDPSSKDDPAPESRAKRTLHDELTEAMDVVSETLESAQRVAALRAEKGKDLSHRNREGLDGLARAMEQLQALLDDAPQEPDDSVVDPAPDPVDVNDAGEIEQELARFVELSLSIP